MVASVAGQSLGIMAGDDHDVDARAVAAFTHPVAATGGNEVARDTVSLTPKRLRTQQPKAATGGKKLVKRKPTSTAQKYTVDDQPSSTFGWQFRVRESGGRRRIVYRMFVTANDHAQIRSIDYEGFKRGLIEDVKATLRQGG